ncbi:MAG TPA: peptidoglycan-binding protein LysM [Xanthomonadaceae bacterium]|nr:peptidoglycan-binding protein LysM [Xanthomonadaceae bacterium]
MGIFDFVKEAGARLFGGKKPGDNVETYKPLRQHVADNGINPSGIEFKVQGHGVVVVSGSVPDQDTREKVVLIVGNVEGVERVDDQLRIGPAGAPGAGTPLASGAAGLRSAAMAATGNGGQGWTSRTYTVESGDTLSGIASKVYGNAGKYPVIFEANRPMLSDPDKIYPGQMLRIPPLAD